MEKYKLNKGMLLFSILLFVYSLLSLTYYNGYFYVPEAIPPGFIDLNVVLKSTDCYNLGYNPYFAKNEFCTWTYNYPFVWIKLSSLFGLSSKDTYYIGFIFIFIFILSVSFLFKDVSLKKILFITCVLLSPPILFLLERGNIDIVIFELILCLYYFSSKMKASSSIYVTCLLLLISSALKIYPVFMLPILLLENVNQRKRLLLFLITSISIICYFLYNLNELKVVISNTPKPSELAYGKNVLLQEFVPKNVFVYVSLIPFLLVSIYFYFKRDILFQLFNSFDKNDPRFKLFFGVSLIFTGSYFFGNNWDYRLSFLVLLFPFIFSLNNTTRKIRFFKKVFYILTTILLLVSFLHRTAPIYNNYIQWFIGRNFLMSIKYIAITTFASFGIFLFYYILSINIIEFKHSLKKNNNVI